MARCATQVNSSNTWGGSVEDNSQISPATRQVIDAEVQHLVTERYERAQALLKDHHAALKILAQQLLKQETVSGSVVEEALEKASPGAPHDRESLVSGLVPFPV